MIVLLDNYDSFTFNLVQRLGELDPNLDLQVYRNDQITVDEIERMGPSHLIISPGPCTPDRSGHQCRVRRNSLPESCRFWGFAWAINRLGKQRVE